MSDVRDIFVSHVTEDASIALEIAKGLEQEGYTTWYYERDCLPGRSYLDQELEALEVVGAIVLIISSNAISKSQRSRQVDIEVERGHELNLPFVPVLHDIGWPEFQQRQRVWAGVLGATVGISVPPQGVSAILSRIVLGLQGLGIQPQTQAGLPRILHDYPLPLAATYARKMAGAMSQAQAFQVHAGLGEMTRALIKYLALLVLAQYRHDSSTPGREDRDVERELERLKQPALDSWVSLLHAALSLYPGVPDPLLRNLYNFYYTKTHRNNPVADASTQLQNWLQPQSWRRPPVTYRDFFELLLLYHNWSEGWSTEHAVLADYSQYQERIDTLRPALEQALVDLEFLVDYRLIYVQDGGAPPHRILEATGRNLLLASQPMAPSSMVRPQHIYLCRSGPAGLDSLLDLHPLLICENCLSCHDRELFFFHPDKMQQAQYVSYSTGHTLAAESVSQLTESVGIFLSLSDWIAGQRDQSTERLKAVYGNALQEVLVDGDIDAEKRQKLNFLAKILGLDAHQVAKLEKEARHVLSRPQELWSTEGAQFEGNERLKQAVPPDARVEIEAIESTEQETSPALVEQASSLSAEDTAESGTQAESRVGPKDALEAKNNGGSDELPRQYLVCCWQGNLPAPVHQVALFGAPPTGFVADGSGDVRIFDVEGHVLVRDHIQGRLYKVTPLTEKIIAGSWEGGVYCFDRNGLLWHQNLNSPVSALAGAAGKIVVGTWEGRFVAFDEVSGRKQWQSELPDGISTMSIASTGEQIAVGTYAGHLAILDSVGGKVWLQDTQSGLAATLFDQQAQEVVIATRNRIGCIQTENQAVVWDHAIRQTPIDISVSGNNRRLVVGSKDGQVLLFSINGAVSLRSDAHQVEALTQVFIPSLTPEGPLTLALSRRNGLYVLDNRTLVMTRETDTPANRCAMSPDGHYVFIGTDTGVVLYRLARPVLRVELAPMDRLVQGRSTRLKITLQNMGEQPAREIDIKLTGPAAISPVQIPRELPPGGIVESGNQSVHPELDGALAITVQLHYRDDLGLRYEATRLQMLDVQAGS